MKVFSLFFISFLISFKSFGGIVFQDLTISQAKELALKNGKMVFVEFYADACHYCKIMETTVFTDQKLGELISANYIAIKSHSGNIEGKREQSKYRVKIVPTMMFLDPSTSEYFKLDGKKSLDTLMFYSQKHKDGIAANPETNTSETNQNSEMPKKNPAKKEEIPFEPVFRSEKD